MHAVERRDGDARALRAVVSTDRDGAADAVYVGDAAGQVFALDARTGARRWKTRVDAHPAAIVTGAPQLHAGVLYVPVSSYESVLTLQPGYACCTFRGSVVALDAESGRVRWQTWMIPDSARSTGSRTLGPSGAAVWSTPTIDERLDRLYVGTGNNYSEPTSPGSDAVVALDRRTGRVLWTRQYTAKDAYNIACDIPGPGHAGCPTSDGPDADFGQPPILLTLPNGRRALVIGQKSGQVHALDPDRDGAPLWTARVGEGGRLGGVHWGSASDGRAVYVAQGGQGIVPVPADSPPGAMRLEADRTRGGGLVALDPATGRTLWSAPAHSCDTRPRCSPAQSAPVTVVPGAVLSGALDGHLRAYATADGRVLWDVDTAREFTTRDGATARGGSLDVAGPVVAGDMVLVMSGYAQHQAMPGNVLLAFSVDGAPPGRAGDAARTRERHR